MCDKKCQGCKCKGLKMTDKVAQEEQKTEEKRKNALMELIGSINEKFNQLAGQLTGLHMWCESNFKKIETNARQSMVQQSVHDLANSALIKILIKKGIMTEEEYQIEANRLYAETQKKNKEEGK